MGTDGVGRARPPVTRWTARLVDPDQERRFMAHNLLLQRGTAAAAVITILGANVLAFGYSVATGAMSFGGWRLALQLSAIVLGVAMIVVLRLTTAPQRLYGVVAAAVVILTVLVAITLATGSDMAFRAPLIVAGGVVVVYLATPLNLMGVTALAVVYSCVTMPVWLVAVGEMSGQRVAYTVLATLVAHALGFAETRRAMIERRKLFAHREEFETLSNVDQLTGLSNRRAFTHDLTRSWGLWHRTGTPLSVVMLDLDHFKLINDNRGHASGDEVLARVAQLIDACMPEVPGQTAARFGGEEFVCVLPNVPAEQAAEVAETIAAAVREQRISLGAEQGGPILTLSAGVACALPTMEAPADLVGAADAALYRAKRAGRGRVVVSVAERDDTRDEQPAEDHPFAAEA